MGPLDLALAGSSIFSGAGGAIESGSNAGRNGDLSTMRSKEIVGGALVLSTGIILAIREKAVWPIVIAVAVVGLLIGLHEWHARKSMPEPDSSLTLIKGMK